MTPDERARLRELLGRGTPGEWAVTWSDEPERTGEPRVCHVVDGKCVTCVGLMGDVDAARDWTPETLAEWRANAESIVAARNALPALLAAAEECERLREACPRCSHCDKPATCFGSYEGGPSGYGCDDCCGHGNEDGWCCSWSELPSSLDADDAMQKRLRVAATARAEAAERRVAALEAALGEAIESIEHRKGLRANRLRTILRGTGSGT